MTDHSDVSLLTSVTVEHGERLAPSPSAACFDNEFCDVRLARYQRKLRAMALELSLVAQRERRRIAVGLHDNVGQNLAVARLRLEMLRRTVDDAATAQVITEVSAVLEETLTETRRLTFELSPPLLYELGLEAAVRCLAQRFESAHGVVCRVDCDEEQMPLSADVASVVHAVVRELLHNVAKHANAKSVRVAIVRSHANVHVEVADDGDGFECRHESVPFDLAPGFGLFSCRERLLECGGSLEVVSKPGGGTRILLEVPLSSEGDA